ncbi:MAG: type II secretion system protein [Gammaproteobacteria bacterium]|nr:MAG: type II secretion system protein [Gammaproteobacteria bacterium]
MLSSSRRREKGFSLLEVIVALAILGICVTVVLQIMSSVSTAARVTDDYAQALAIAETQMALLIAQENHAGTDTGKVGDQYRWRSRISEYKPSTDNRLFNNNGFIDPENVYRPYHYNVEVTWGGYRKRKLELSTIRLGVTQ